MVFRLAQHQASLLGEACDGAFGKINVRIDSSAYGGPTQGQCAQVFRQPCQAGNAVLDLRGVAAELLSETNRRRILEMGAADLDDLTKLIGLGSQRRLEFFQRRNEAMNDTLERRQMDRRRDHVVARLPLVDMIVWMNRAIAALAAKNFTSAVGDHLVGVHVCGSPGAGLKNVDDKLIVQLARSE